MHAERLVKGVNWNRFQYSNALDAGIEHAAGADVNPAIKYGAYYAPPMYPQFVTGDAITLQGLFKWRKEAIDPVKDAKTSPLFFGEARLQLSCCAATAR